MGSMPEIPRRFLMTDNIQRKLDRLRASALRLAMVSLTVVAGCVAASAQNYFQPGNLVVSRSVYDNNANNVFVGEVLPPNCAQTQAGCAGTATNNGTYPTVWNNDLVDGSFGITSKILLDQFTPAGLLVNTLQVPFSSKRGILPLNDILVTSFSSKSEIALNRSTDGQYLTFMGYVDAIDDLDVSNSNTPLVIDPTNPVGTAFYRAVALVDVNGNLSFTETQAYSGNNGRAAIFNHSNGESFFYTAGNAGNGGNPQPDGVIIGAGAQILNPLFERELLQRPGLPTPVGSFNITQLGDKADKIGKDTNFRGLTIFNNVIYYTKGSGGNGVNTVYFVDTSGSDSNGNPSACPAGTGLPSASASLPTAPIQYDPSVLQTKGVFPYNMCVLNGLPAALSSKTSFPFGVWFADGDTLYVADEGNGTNT